MIRGMKMEDMVQECLNRFCHFYPEALASLKRQMEWKRSIQRQDNGVGEQIGYIGEIPEQLHAIMCLNIHPQWRHDPEVRNIFWRLFRVGRVNPHNYHAGDSKK